MNKEHPHPLCGPQELQDELESVWKPLSSSHLIQPSSRFCVGENNISVRHSHVGLKSVFYECGWGDGLTREKKKSHPSAASMMSFLTASALTAQLPARLQAVAFFPWDSAISIVSASLVLSWWINACTRTLNLCAVSCARCACIAAVRLPSYVSNTGLLIWSCLHLRCTHLKQIWMLNTMCWLTVLCKITAAQLCSSLGWIVKACHAWSFQWDLWAFYPLKCSFHGHFSAGKWFCQAHIVDLSVLIVFPVMFI